jgi:hypothetical protein
MQEANIDDLLSKTSMLMLRFEQRCQVIEQQQQLVANELKSLTQQLPYVVKKSVEDLLRQLPKGVQENVDAALQQTVAEYRQQYQSSSQQVGQGAQHLSREMERLERIHCMLVWKVVGVTTACLALLLVGGVWLSVDYAGVIRDDQMSAETLKTFNAEDVVLCEGRLCANVDVHGRRYGMQGQYVPVKAR